MALVVDRRIPDIAHSVYRYLKFTQYTVGSDTGTLVDFFPGLKFSDAYPDDLMKVDAPLLAVSSVEAVRKLPSFFGDAIFGTEHDIAIFGFVVGRGGDHASRLFRDRMINDVVWLMENAGDEGIPLIEQASKGVIGVIEVTRVAARAIGANAPEVQADRYKFVVELTVEYA